MNETMPAFFKSKFSPSETFDGRSNSRHEVLSPERAVASCSTASDLRHAVAAFPQIWFGTPRSGSRNFG